MEWEDETTTKLNQTLQLTLIMEEGSCKLFYLKYSRK